MAELSPEIVAFYQEGTEAARLSRGLGRLEFARMQELLLRYFPSSAESSHARARAQSCRLAFSHGRLTA